jgi:hypothetical protein
MTDAVRRAIRTFIQAFVGTFVLVGFPVLQNIMDATNGGDEPIFDVNVWKRVLVACVISGVIALVSYVQNALEDKTMMPAVLKAPASQGQNPAPADGGVVN